MLELKCRTNEQKLLPGEGANLSILGGVIEEHCVDLEQATLGTLVRLFAELHPEYLGIRIEN